MCGILGHRRSARRRGRGCRARARSGSIAAQPVHRLDGAPSWCGTVSPPPESAISSGRAPRSCDDRGRALGEGLEHDDAEHLVADRRHEQRDALRRRAVRKLATDAPGRGSARARGRRRCRRKSSPLVALAGDQEVGRVVGRGTPRAARSTPLSRSSRPTKRKYGRSGAGDASSAGALDRRRGSTGRWRIGAVNPRARCASIVNCSARGRGRRARRAVEQPAVAPELRRPAEGERAAHALRLARTARGCIFQSTCIGQTSQCSLRRVELHAVAVREHAGAAGERDVVEVDDVEAAAVRARRAARGGERRATGEVRGQGRAGRGARLQRHDRDARARAEDSPASAAGEQRGRRRSSARRSPRGRAAPARSRAGRRGSRRRRSPAAGRTSSPCRSRAASATGGLIAARRAEPPPPRATTGPRPRTPRRRAMLARSASSRARSERPARARCVAGGEEERGAVQRLAVRGQVGEHDGRAARRGLDGGQPETLRQRRVDERHGAPVETREGLVRDKAGEQDAAPRARARRSAGEPRWPPTGTSRRRARRRRRAAAPALRAARSRRASVSTFLCGLIAAGADENGSPRRGRAAQLRVDLLGSPRPENRIGRLGHDRQRRFGERRGSSEQPRDAARDGEEPRRPLDGQPRFSRQRARSRRSGSVSSGYCSAIVSCTPTTVGAPRTGNHV